MLPVSPVGYQACWQCYWLIILELLQVEHLEWQVICVVLFCLGIVTDVCTWLKWMQQILSNKSLLPGQNAFHFPHDELGPELNKLPPYHCQGMSEDTNEKCFDMLQSKVKQVFVRMTSVVYPFPPLVLSAPRVFLKLELHKRSNRVAYQTANRLTFKASHVWDWERLMKTIVFYYMNAIEMEHHLLYKWDRTQKWVLHQRRLIIYTAVLLGCRFLIYCHCTFILLWVGVSAKSKLVSYIYLQSTFTMLYKMKKNSNKTIIIFEETSVN